MVATQFEDVDARRCFPCWDEPALKVYTRQPSRYGHVLFFSVGLYVMTMSCLQATFKITLQNIPCELTALSNMPVSEEKLCGDTKTVHFEESVLMSTYLVALVVGLFDYVEDIAENGIE